MKGFKKYLRIRGLGFKIFKESQLLKFQLGYSHFIFYKIPILLKFEILGSKSRILKIIGLDLDLVNQVSFLIKTFRKPGIYKQKGIYFTREIVRLKAGKKKKFR
jgi:large subunit ribosomal protein L6